MEVCAGCLRQLLVCDDCLGCGCSCEALRGSSRAGQARPGMPHTLTPTFGAGVRHFIFTMCFRGTLEFSVPGPINLLSDKLCERSFFYSFYGVLFHLVRLVKLAVAARSRHFNITSRPREKNTRCTYKFLEYEHRTHRKRTSRFCQVALLQHTEDARAEHN